MKFYKYFIQKYKLEILLVLFSFWLNIEFLIFGKESIVNMFDMGDHHIPYAISVAKDIKEYGFFLWNKNIKSGVDLISQSYIWTNLVGFSLPFFIYLDWKSYALTKLLIIFLSIFYSYKIFNDFAKVAKSTSILAALLVGIFFLNESSEGLISKPLYPCILYLLIKISDFQINFLKVFFITLLVALLYASSGFFIWDYYSYIGFISLGLIWSKNKKKIYLYFFDFFSSYAYLSIATIFSFISKLAKFT